ncbi:MAG: hypothetical protein KGD60_15220 [Candidatus Thorarchaeota archaeon]|nr:hypothetical protein [Candidatus Thorarchaeota archaeon]
MAKRQQEVKCQIATPAMIYVWADDEMVELIEKVEGVYEVGGKLSGHFAAFVDQRYNAEEIAKEIEALA